MLKLNVWKFRLRDDQFDHPGADSHGELSSVSVSRNEEASMYHTGTLSAVIAAQMPVLSVLRSAGLCA